MFVGIRSFCAPFLFAMFVMSYAGSAAIAQDATWHVSKSSGDVWVTNSGVQQASVTAETILKPGDSIRTGQTGRVLLVRGEESMLISPNSVISIPKGQRDGMSTTIIQQAGSILLEVEKRNVKHFEVETPYLAAVVKGTQFRVTANRNDSSVDVLRGQVEVTDFKSGQRALVQRSQTAKVSAQGAVGLSLSGSGALSPIQQGTPRSSSVSPVAVPEEGLSAPDNTPKAQQGRAASLPGQGESVLASSAGNAAQENGWSSGLVTPGKSFGNGNGWWTRHEDITFALSFPFGVGIFVAVTVAAQRRWRKRRLRLR
jgi:hypothetical protein